jgi:hypothetical protein
LKAADHADQMPHRAYTYVGMQIAEVPSGMRLEFGVAHSRVT